MTKQKKWFKRIGLALLARKGIARENFRPQSHREYQQSQYDLLADAVRASLDLDAVYRTMGLANPNQKK